MFRPCVLVIFCYILSAKIPGSSARRWFPIGLVKSATVKTESTVQTNRTPSCNVTTTTSCGQVNITTPNLKTTNCNVSNENISIVPIIKGDSLDTKKTTLHVDSTCSRATSTKKCTATKEICRFTLPATPTYRKFMIGIHRDSSDACGEKNSCCHPGGGRPKYPDGYHENGITKDRNYEQALSGELAERIVDRIFKRSAEKGNPIIDPVTTKEQLKALSKILHSSTLEREGCCFKLSGELKCFLAFLLLQRPTRRKRSCGCFMETGNLGSLGQSGNTEYQARSKFKYRDKEIRPVINLSNFQLPVSLYGFQPPPLLNLP